MWSGPHPDGADRVDMVDGAALNLTDQPQEAVGSTICIVKPRKRAPAILASTGALTSSHQGEHKAAEATSTLYQALQPHNNLSPSKIVRVDDRSICDRSSL